MAIRTGAPSLRRFLVLAALLVLGTTHAPAGHFGNNNNGGGVGGISVDTDGVVRSVKVDSRKALRDLLLKEVKKAAGDMNQPVELRMVSLRGLEAAIVDARRNNLGQLPEEVQFLAGLQRIELVLVNPQDNDVVLAGPGEGWRIDENANVVGVTTGRPVLHLDDLIIALRTVEEARRGGISCSIDPTQEGRVALDRYLKTVRAFTPQTTQGMQDALGMQRITLQGVPGNSHMARVLVAADYHMKRIAMNLDRSPVASLPGFLDLLKANRTKLENVMPRWWLACHYEPLLRSEDGLTWQLRGQGVKAMTEDDFVQQDGAVVNTGRKSPVAQQWADLMTEKYKELAQASPVFGELRNVMDMCVVAALLEKEQLLQKAGLSLPTLTGADGVRLTTTHWSVPKAVATQCSFLHTGREYIVTASGGVQIESWQVAQNAQVGEGEDARTLEKLRARSAVSGAKSSWWWQ